MKTCSTPGCDRVVIAKGLCRSCYQTQRLAQKRKEQRDNLVRICRNPKCQAEFSGRDIRAVFCSLECKEQERSDRLKSRLKSEKNDRHCTYCGEPIPVTMRKDAKFCSTQHSDDYHNSVRKAQLLNSKQTRMPCVICGTSIPPEAKASAIYCSETCKNKQMHRIQREVRYGLTQEQIDEMLKAQGNKCASCGRTEPGGRGEWHVDHDRSCCPGAKTCGKCIRGILCHSCNVGSGCFKDDPARLRAHADYIEQGRSMRGSHGL